MSTVNKFIWSMVKTATHQNGDTKTATVQNGDKSKRRQT